MQLSSIFKPLMCTIFVLLSAKNGLAQRGTLDGGGANGSNHKLIESFRAKPVSLPTKQLVQPLLDFLEKSMIIEKEFNLGRYYYALKNILNKHAWYIIESQGTDIGTSRHGIPFYVDQYAIQTVREVFIFEDLYKKIGQINPLEQEKIILHELFMGLKILMKMDSYTQCVYVSSSSNCNDENDPEQDSLIPSSKDHAQVRALTDFIYERRDLLNDSSKEKELVFDLIRELDLNQFQNKFFKPYRMGSTNTLASSIAKVIKKKELEKDNYLYCDHWKTQTTEDLQRLKLKWDSAPKGTKLELKSKFKVKIVVEDKDDNLFFKLKDKHGKVIETVTRNKSDVIYGHNTNSRELRDVLSSDNKTVEFYLEEKKPKDIKVGQKYQSIQLEINPETKELIAYRSYDVVTTEYEPTVNGGYSSSGKYFEKLNCTSQEFITFTK
ncbi:MAG: hypothetical protein L6Q37_14025 [Bdellovibrionaceae bacterium]|nr:hypothetical protein [Pseudobdellovibrionaceae bacterium]NUM58029.1 hypothetical protein [Pseudobdellovibrionaceae bacterium]